MDFRMLQLVFFLSCLYVSAQESDNFVESLKTNKKPTELLSRHKRLVIANHEWKNGIVPYVYLTQIGDKEQLEIESAMFFVEKFTCIRFVPWSPQTRTTYDLDHDGYVRFENSKSCFADVGNKKQPQKCSCCDRFSCVHELGHVLGLHHTHHSHKATGWIRINFNELRKSHMYVYRVMEEKDIKEYTYDITSMMHYPEQMYKTSYRPTMNKLIRGLKTTANRFYAFRDINWVHKCKDKRCNWFHKKCENDGYITTVDGMCQCSCPLRLDPETGCTQMIKKREKFSWPAGHFALMATQSGCPEGKFGRGSLTHWGDGRNWHIYTSSKERSTLHLKGVHSAKRHTYHFCTSRNYSPLGREWPAGSYCILREGGFCPYKFKEGNVQFDNEIRSRRQNNTFHGELPDGEFGSDVKLIFCCRDDGLPEYPMALPNDKPLILFQAKALGYRCQEVSGMSYKVEYFTFDNIDDGKAKISGTAPRNFVYSGAQFLMYYCYYEPSNYNCGGVFNLNRHNTSLTITSLNYPEDYGSDEDCVWLIKAPEDSKLILTFEDFEIGNDLHNCNDGIGVGTGLIGQHGEWTCGSWNRDSFFSIYNTINVRFRTNVDSHQKGFKAKISLITSDDMCYSWADQGNSYRGKVNMTDTMKPCLHWSSVTHCPHHTFKNGDYQDGLEGNYCRNPGDGLKPWCYIHADGCEREYCDVCMHGPIHDTINNCEELKNETVNFCGNDFRAQSHCAKSCESILPMIPQVTKEKDIQCALPKTMKDGIIVTAIKEYYKVGEVIQFRCVDSGEIINTTCLTDTTWSVVNHVCDVCPVGWSVYKKHCYRFFPEEILWVEADEKCRSIDAILTTAADPNEHEFVVTLRIPLRSVWIGLRRDSDTKIMEWSNGEKVVWTNFNKDGPSTEKDEHCVVITGEENQSKWDDKICTYQRRYSYICKMKAKTNKHCSDRITNCEAILKDSPSMCMDQTSFASSQCSQTCGACDKHSTPRCETPDKPDHVRILVTRRHLYRGRTVQYECIDGYTLESGNLNRVCTSNGTLSGQPPVCKPINMTRSLSNKIAIKDRGDFGTTSFVYTGRTPELIIQRHGRLVEWHLYSTTPGNIHLQIYRPKNETSNEYELLSSKPVTTKERRIERILVPASEQIDVQPGDLLGVWVESKNGISMEHCNGNYYTASNKMKKMKFSDTKLFKPGYIVKFPDENDCFIISLRAVIGPVSDVDV